MFQHVLFASNIIEKCEKIQELSRNAGKKSAEMSVKWLARS